MLEPVCQIGQTFETAQEFRRSLPQTPSFWSCCTSHREVFAEHVLHLLTRQRKLQ